MEIRLRHSMNNNSCAAEIKCENYAKRQIRKRIGDIIKIE